MNYGENNGRESKKLTSQLAWGIDVNSMRGVLIAIQVIMLSLLAGAFFHASAAEQSNDGRMSLSTRWLTVKGLGQELPKNSIGVVVKARIDGKEQDLFLPVTQDTYVRKGGEVSQAKSGALVLRDGGYSVALLQLDLQALPPGAEILAAAFQFKPQYVEKKGGRAVINCSRMLTPWAETAVYSSPNPGANGQAWDGPAAKRDYEAAPFASIKIDSLDPKETPLITIPGFADAVKAWRDGTWKNNGFLISFGGGALQLNLPSRESYDAVTSYVIGGEKGGSVLLVPNVPLLEHLLLKPQDLLAAYPALFLPAKQSKIPATGAAKLDLYEVSLANDNETIDANGGRKLIASVPLAELNSNVERVLLPDIGRVVQSWVKEPGRQRGLQLVLEGAVTPSDARLIVANNITKKAQLQLDLPSYTPASLFPLPLKPKSGVYTQVRDGHLYYDGQRLRLWGVVGKPEVKRLANMGFNAERVWYPSWRMLYDKKSAKRGEFSAFVVSGTDAAVEKDDFLIGDAPTKFDQAEKHIAELKNQGLFIMFASLCDTIDPKLLLDDDSFVAGGTDWESWKAAIKEGTNINRFLYVDRRLQDIKKRHAKNLLTHVNRYTGKAYGEEEAIAIYEIFNENGFVWSVLSNGFDKWPSFFLKELQDQWNVWLKKKYKDENGLLKAWGAIKQGESLNNSTIAPVPDIKQRGDYPAQRGNDFIQFLTELSDNYHQDFRSYCRSLFPKGVGVNVVPFSFDTQFRPNLPWSYFQSLGDVNSFGMYFWNLDSMLSKPPTGYVIDSATVENKPSVLYETNRGRPSPYRTEYPLKLAAMAAYQDWDGVFWHYWGADGQSDAGDLGYLAGVMMPPERTHYWTAVHHETDPVMDTAMMMAGQIFQHGLLAKATNPDVVEVGRQALFTYLNFAGVDLAQSTFHKGSRLRFSPGKDTALTMNGQAMPAPVRIDKAVGSGEQIKWDWPNERLVIDAPAVKVYVGKVNGAFRFADGITIGDISTPWICFAMVSEDGSPLAGDNPAKRVLVSGVFDAKNTDFRFNYDVKGGPVEQANAVADRGHEPVVVTLVKYTVWFPTKISGNIKSYDFALRETASSVISDTNQVVEKDGTPFVKVLAIDKRGATAKLPLETATPISMQDWTPKAAGTQTTASIDSRALILPELPWDSNYAEAHRSLRDSTYPFTNISGEDTGSAAKKSIVVSGIQLPSLWNLLINLNLDFTSDKLTGVEVTFLQPPSLGEVQKDFTRRLGEPKEVKMDAQYGNSRLHWTRGSVPHDVLVTESQGIMKILITP
jgi:hypothetical protein